MGVFTYFLRDLEQILFPNRDQHPIPAMDGGYTPNDRLDALSPIGAPIPGADDIAEGGDGAIYVSAGKQVPTDEWLASGLNHGCVLKFTASGDVLESYWDPTGISHSTLTSMREHKGYLYLGGLENNRIGRIKLDHVDPTWTGYEAYWGNKRRTRG